MRRRQTGGLVLAVAAWSALASAAAAGGEPVKLPPELAEVLAAARDDLRNNRPGEAVARLEAFAGTDHPLRHLLLGHAYVRRSDLSRAAGAYRRALAMDPGMRQAGIALAQVHARQENWPASAELLGRFLAVDTCDADMLYLYAQVARRLDDRRLCRLLVSKGIFRFPRDLRFRRLDLAALIDEGDHPNAARAARRLVGETPGDALLWQQLAYATAREGGRGEQLAAIEAGLLCEPTDPERHRQFLAALLVAGDWATAIRHGRSLLAGPLPAQAGSDADIMDLLVRAADMGQRDELLGAWLKRLPEKARTPSMRIVEARWALRQGRTAQARQALRTLIAAGETDPGVLLWAGHLAEAAKDWPEAETYYAQARRSTGRSSELATLYLARLWFFTGRHDQAARLLQSHLDTRPEDASARALLALVTEARRNARPER